jgi:hypothetical protein
LNDRITIDTNNGNYLSRESPTIQIPLLIQVRAHCAIAAVKQYLQSSNNVVSDDKDINQLRTADEVYLAIKDEIKSSLKDSCQSQLFCKSSSNHTRHSLPPQLHEEEAGYLSIHVITIPPPLNSFPMSNVNDKVSFFLPPTLKSYITKHEESIRSANYKVLHPRTRFRGNDPTLKQGGDPRKNLELRLRREMGGVSAEDCLAQKRRKMDSQGREDSCELNEADWNTMISWLDKVTVNGWCKEDNCSLESAKWLQQHGQSLSSLTQHCSVSATTWRRPFCIHGYYTKTR